MATRVMKLELIVRVPHTVGEGEVSNAINAALDEPPCNWGNWFVGIAHIVNVQHVNESVFSNEEEEEIS